MKTWAWIIPGFLLPLLFSELPGLPGLAGLGCLLVLALYRRIFPLLFFLAGIAWTLFHLQARLEERLLEFPAGPTVLSGTIASLPVQRGDLLEFRFRTNQVPGGELTPGTILLVRWYRDYPRLLAGEKWRLALNLKPARSRVNFQGPDRERWYFAQGISALGIVESERSHRLGPPETLDMSAMRQKTRGTIRQILDEHQARPLILALALADRSEISAEAWNRFRLTGTSHLLAISGMHVGLAAVMGFWLGRFLALLGPARFVLAHGLKLAWLGSILLATLYSVMAGLGTSTRRALIMLAVFCLVSLLKRSTSAWQGLVLAMSLVLLMNPLATLGAGFWMSFLAVAVLLAVFVPRHGNLHWSRAMLMAQGGLAIVMYPVGMLWFQQVTLLGMVTNLVAIPWISFGVVPATLLAVLLLPLDNWLAPFLFYSAAESVCWLEAFLQWMEHAGQGAWFMTAKPGLAITVLASLGGLMLLLPRTFPLRFAGLLLLLPLALPQKRAAGQLGVEMLDVGQGLAILIETPKRVLLYDSGPGDGESWSMVPSALAPALARMNGHPPALFLISHGDLDHSGGLFELQRRFPATPVLASLREDRPGIESCRSPRSWQWGEVQFEVLHPAEGLPYLGNDSSCVLSIRFLDHGLLLTGDISTAVEARLTESGLDEYSILFVPHHGSKSSSGSRFIEAAAPEVALVSAAYQNPFNFPHPVVQQRYRDLNIPLLSSAACGAIRIDLGDTGEAQLTSARRARAAIWRWPAEAECP